jgi:hypothetical protein
MSYKITGKKAGIVWDAKANKPLCRFKNGEATVTTKAEADKLEKLGYKAAEIKPKGGSKKEDDTPPGGSAGGNVNEQDNGAGEGQPSA